jgi:hypothetical protein
MRYGVRANSRERVLDLEIRVLGDPNLKRDFVNLVIVASWPAQRDCHSANDDNSNDDKHPFAETARPDAR